MKDLCGTVQTQLEEVLCGRLNPTRPCHVLLVFIFGNVTIVVDPSSMGRKLFFCSSIPSPTFLSVITFQKDDDACLDDDVLLHESIR